MGPKGKYGFGCRRMAVHSTKVLPCLSLKTPAVGVVAGPSQEEWPTQRLSCPSDLLH